MEFNLAQAVEILERTPRVLYNLLHGLSDDWVMNNEGEATWSPYDVVGHLIHGERTDWIPRLNKVLAENGNKTFEPFDRFAQFHESKGKTIDRLLEEFAQLRKENLEKLHEAQITPVMLDKKGIHPFLGEVTLRHLLSTWAAHDLAHLAQISRVMAKQYTHEVGPWREYIRILQ